MNVFKRGCGGAHLAFTALRAGAEAAGEELAEDRGHGVQPGCGGGAEQDLYDPPLQAHARRECRGAARLPVIGGHSHAPCVIAAC